MERQGSAAVAAHGNNSGECSPYVVVRDVTDYTIRGKKDKDDMGDWRRLFSKEMLAEGEQYYQSGKAKKLQEITEGFSATVRGSRNYKVEISTYGDGETICRMTCTCDEAGGRKVCKHMAAALFLIEEEYWTLSVDGNTEMDACAGHAPSGGPGGMGKDVRREKKDKTGGPADGGSRDFDGGKDGPFGRGGNRSAPVGDEEPQKGAEAAGAGREKKRKKEKFPPMPPHPTSALEKLAQKDREELAMDEAQKAPARHMEPYRYFQYERFEEGVEIDPDVRRKAKKLAEGRALTDQKLTFGYTAKQFWDEEEAPQILHGFATAKFDRGYGHVRLVFDNTHIVEATCSSWECRGNSLFNGFAGKINLCEHGLALLSWARRYIEKNNPGDATSLGGMRLLDGTGRSRYMLEEGERPDAPPVSLEPVVALDMEVEDAVPTLSFRTGTGRLYKVKKIREYVKAVQEGQQMQFGKSTQIQLGEELLAEEALPWYRFMRDALREERQRNIALGTDADDRYYGIPGYQVGEQIADAIPLYGASLDTFFREARGKRVEFVLREKNVPYRRGAAGKTKAILLCCDRELDLQFEISPWYGIQMREGAGGSGMGASSGRGRTGAKRKKGGKGAGDHAAPFQGVRVCGALPILIGGRDASYFVDAEKQQFCRVDRAQVEKLAPILDAAQGGKLDAVIGRKNLREFYRDALPRLREAANVIEYGTDVIEAYIPPEPAFYFYFDIEGDCLLCRPDVHYGLQVNTIMDRIPSLPFYNAEPASYRDTEKEDHALDVLTKYMTRVFSDIKVFFLEREDEERVFNLLAYGLDELMGCGEVRMTEAFRRLGLRRRLHFSVGVSVESKLMDLEILSDDISPEELLSVFYQYQKKRKFVRLKNGDFLQLDQNETIDQLLEIMETMGVSLKEFVRGKMQVPAYRALYLDKMLDQMQDVYTNRDRHFKNLIKEFKTVEDSDFEVPASLRGILRKYQVAGYRWLRTLDHYGFGGILADEMGLGKTLQVIAVLLADKEARQEALLLPAPQGPSAPEAAEAGGGEAPALLPAPQGPSASSATSLVVCPASLVYNWGEELRRFAPALRAGIVAGTRRERSAVIEGYRAYDVLVTSYDLLKRDIDAYEGKAFRFEVIDEAQYIKNQGTAAAKSVKLVQAQTRFALTGTPIENRLSELWSIFDYLMPGFLYTYTRFHADFEQQIVKFEDEAAAERLRRMASPFILRRRKEEVLRDLPEKLEEVRYAAMESKQRKLYDGQVVRMKKDMQGQSEADFRKSRIQILAELTKIRQICCDPSLLLANYDGGSAKREACMDLVHNVIEGEHKALIFSQFATMLELLEEEFKKEGIDYYKITGATPKEKRMEMVKAFNGDRTPVFLISLKAGGTGLNLTGADVVIHYDPWWNVAAQNQATDRAHRIGQTRIVTVYKLIVKGTIEERILQMQEAKRKLAEDILSDEAISSSAISREDLLELLG